MVNRKSRVPSEDQVGECSKLIYVSKLIVFHECLQLDIITVIFYVCLSLIYAYMCKSTHQIPYLEL